MNHYVYEITNNINGMKYIGKRSCECDIEKDGYMGGGTKLKEAKEKFGLHNFSKKILAIADDEAMAFDLESYYIEKRNAVESEAYYNQVYGGTISHMFKHHDKEKLALVRKKLSEKNKGKNKGEKSGVSKKVICLNTGEIFVSVAEASLSYGLSRGTVSKACSPNGDCKTAGKHPETGERLKWMYYDEYLAKENGEVYIYKNTTAPIRKSRSRKVVCITTGEIFSSISEASKAKKAWNISHACINGNFSGVCDKTGERLKWMYYDDYIKMKEVDNDE